MFRTKCYVNLHDFRNQYRKQVQNEVVWKWKLYFIKKVKFCFASSCQNRDKDCQTNGMQLGIVFVKPLVLGPTLALLSSPRTIDPLPWNCGEQITIFVLLFRHWKFTPTQHEIIIIPIQFLLLSNWLISVLVPGGWARELSCIF